jgi:molecular chaperone GrpE
MLFDRHCSGKQITHDMKYKEQPQNGAAEPTEDENTFNTGDAYPDCESSSCANMAENEPEDAPETVKMAEASEANEAIEWRDKYLRLSAEFDNYRKRTLREKMELVSGGGSDVVKALLPVLDDFDRAFGALEKSGESNPWCEGVVLISNKLRDILRSKGVVEIEAVGAVLDTDLHEAVVQVPASKSESGKVVDVVQKGYMMNDKVIRHAKVVVGQ